MSKVIAINGSPETNKGTTAMILEPFLQGIKKAGYDTELLYASRLKIKPCSCSVMHCWNDTPGECCIQDDMELVYPKLREAEIVIFATPVYIPLPGAMQNFINRLCPLINPVLQFREGRTRARIRQGVNVRKFVLVASGGWWELGNFDTLVRIIKELSEDASVEFGGAVLRPHAHLMKFKGEFTADGLDIVDALNSAGMELVQPGGMTKSTLDRISRPLITQEEQWRRYEKAGEAWQDPAHNSIN